MPQGCANEAKRSAAPEEEGKRGKDERDGKDNRDFSACGGFECGGLEFKIRSGVVRSELVLQCNELLGKRDVLCC